ncbi:hypothetical protein TIFTF001_016828 [Ficus carica]|uniref:Uncharacterized protein n=1 Tax=Ficus carica TaxID=3494 RepID=A0AA88D7Q4_FICCA|nr:hypothetical protein TIFTF001_016828 [Ficus carica]
MASVASLMPQSSGLLKRSKIAFNDIVISQAEWNKDYMAPFLTQEKDEVLVSTSEDSDVEHFVTPTRGKVHIIIHKSKGSKSRGRQFGDA